MKHLPPLPAWIGPILVSMLFSGPVAAAQDCRAADALLKAGYIDEAKAAYVGLLGGDDAPECAGEGLSHARKQELAQSTELCAAAESLLGAGYLEEAKTAYVKLLNGDGTTKPVCAREGLASVKSKQAAQGSTAISHAQALSKFGLHKEALETVETLLKADGNTEIPQDLQYLSGGKIPFWRELRRDLEPWARPILEIAVAIILITLLSALLARRFTRRTLAIEEFDKGGFEGEHLGKDTTSIIRSQLNRIADGSHRGRISLVTGPIEAIDIPAEVEAAVPATSASWLSPITWVKAIPALFNWLSPARTISLTGHLHKPGNRGLGITVQLVESSSILASHTFWHKDFDDTSEPAIGDATDSLHQLAGYVAVWLVFRMAEKFGSGLQLLGTDNWRSYVYFRAGLLAESQSRDAAAKRLYIRALRLDPKLRGARVNLAVWFLRHHEPEAALEQLSRAKQDCEKASDGDRDPTLYSAIYNLAALKYDNFDTGQHSDPLPSIRETKDLTLELLEKIDSTLTSIQHNKKGYRDPALKYHLQTIRPVANTMLGGLQVELGDPEGKQRVLDETVISSVYPRLQYNLACGYSVLAKHEPRSTPEEQANHEGYLQASLSHLERSFQIQAGIVNQVKDDRSLEYVQAAKAVEFQALLKAYGPAPVEVVEPVPELPLAEVETIGDEYAKKLLDENIRTADELLQITLEPMARQILAAKLNVTELMLTGWAHAMDLLRIVGLGPPQLRLLALAQVHRLSQLEASNPASLKALLDDLSNSGLGIDPPDISVVNAWVNDARTNTRPKVI